MNDNSQVCVHVGLKINNGGGGGVVCNSSVAV